MYFVYILKSRKDNGCYVGMTSNLDKRIAYHNKGLVRSTKHRVPFEIIHSESFSSRAEARQREKYLKSYKGSREKMTIVENWGIV